VKAARERGLSIPDDLTITGYDDISEATRAGLTTVGQPHVEKGRVAGELYLTAPTRSGDRRRLLSTHLAAGATSGPPRAPHVAADIRAAEAIVSTPYRAGFQGVTKPIEQR
jgi:DNA-binding LacI/PurR family transcriptional regulator